MVIDKEILATLRMWFCGYVASFCSRSEDLDANVALKAEHTRGVCGEILDIGRSLGLNEADLRFAETVALLHDVGRFEQYARYGTFMDGRSENHAALGVRVLRKEGVLKTIDCATRVMILRIVGGHNRASLPGNENERTLLFLKLLRDADKIDIWRVVTEFYHGSESIRRGAVELGLPDRPEISEPIVAKLLEGRIARVEDLRTLNDAKLLQMGWVFDINFTRTSEIVRQRRYLDKLYQVLPHTDAVDRIYRKGAGYVNAGAGSAGEVPIAKFEA